MNKTVIGATLILAVAALIGLFFYTENTRYEVVIGEVLAYKWDHRTGEIWMLSPQGQRKLPELAIKYK